MITKITYDSIKGETPLGLIGFIKSKQKKAFEEFKVSDFIKEDMMKVPFVDINYTDIFSFGVYMFISPDYKSIYVGKSKNGFYDRLMGQKNTKFKMHWGWNAILQKMALKKLHKQYSSLTDQDMGDSLIDLKKYYLVLIEVNDKAFPIGRLENLIMRAINTESKSSLLNNSITSLRKLEHIQTVNQILQ